MPSSRRSRAGPSIGSLRLRPPAAGAAETSLRFEPRYNVPSNGFDLARLIFVRHEDEFLHPDGKMRLELLHALVDGAENGAVLGGFAPRRIVPFLAEPFH